MKRRIFSFGFVVFTIGLLFASCIGDNDTTMNVGNDFVYVTTYDSQKYASSSEYSGVYFTADAVLSAITNRCYFASYSISSSDMTGNLFNAKNLDMGSAIPQSGSVQFEAPASSVSDVAIALGSFSVQRFNSADVLGDKWLISINLTKTEGDIISGYIYYDENNQSTDGSALLATNKIVLDVMFTNTKVSTEKDVKTDYSYVLDLAKIRTNAAVLKNGEGTNVADFNLDVSGKKYAPLQIIFRYKKASTTATGLPVTSYFPAAAGSTSSIMYIASK